MSAGWFGRGLGLALGVLLLAAGVTAAQDAGAPEGQAAQRAFCFTPGPESICRSFWLTEMSVLIPVASSSETVQILNGPTESYRAFGPHVSWQLGYLRNVGARSALGASLMAGVGGPSGRAGFRVNYRHWLGSGNSVDLAVGPYMATVEGYSQRSGKGVSADVRYTYEDRFAFTIRTERVWTESKTSEPAGFHEFPTAQALYAGVTLGRKPALWGTAAAAGGVVLYGLAYWVFGPRE